MSTTQSKLFFITGVSTGFGRALAQTALADGHRVVGTLRDQTALGEFELLGPGRAIGKLLDVTHTDAIAGVVADIEGKVGPIDVLVNNAGYGYESLLEESTLDEWRKQFDVNVFGAVAMMQAVLPYMRRRKRGHIINITSMGGYITGPGIGAYNGTKFALEGISESLSKEVKDFGIKVTAVAPGAFRTDWAGRSMVRAQRSIPDYDAVFNHLRERRQAISGKQPGDPAKAARAILEIVAASEPPVHLLLGPDAVKLVNEKLDALRAELKAWEPLSKSTDFS
ncbi:oxidoreductase [Trinickia sp. Y13]|uniref:oxidoreductase n=1 Tax=Trinickia sp. Y13 TaxID=2917807 RepID=UPI002405FF9A|nr:oxidoreductase [Trinickia sp. Y13]MDG0024467.1 oxidoreductase [Trinickia sp. Y13]